MLHTIGCAGIRGKTLVWKEDYWKEEELSKCDWRRDMGCQAMVEVPETKLRVEISLILRREIRVGVSSIPFKA